MRPDFDVKIPEEYERAHKDLVRTARLGRPFKPQKISYATGISGIFARRPMVIAALCMLAGDIIGLSGQIALEYWLGGALAATILALGALAIKKPRAWTLLICVLFAGGIMGQSAIVSPEIPAAGEYYVTGRVAGVSKLANDKLVIDISDYQADDTIYRGILRLTLYRGAGQWAEETEPQELPDEFAIGAGVGLYAEIWLPQGARNEGGFDYRAYLARHGVHACATTNLSDAKFTPAAGFNLQNWFFTLRMGVIDRLDAALGDMSPTAQSIMLGQTGQMDEQTLENYRQAGFSHILAVSGMHVSVIIMLLGWALIFLPGKARMAAISVVIFMYCGITGFSASVVRAGIMGFIMIWTQQAGYRYDGPSALAIALIVILSCTPGAALDTGFALTFAAVLAIYAFYPGLSGAIPRVRIYPKRKFAHARAEKCAKLACRFVSWCANWAINCVKLSICVTGALLPLTSAYFGQVNVLGLLTSVVGIAAGMGVLLFGWLSVLLDWAGFLGQWMAWATDVCARMITSTAEWTAGLSFGIINMRAVSPWWLLAFAPLMLLASHYRPLKKPLRALSTLAASGLMLALLLPPMISDGLDYIMLDVGQGDAQVITDGRDALLIDVGEENSYAADYVRARGLNVRGIIITHLHADHAGALAQAVNQTGARTVYLPENAENAADAPVITTLTGLESAGINIIRLRAGDSMDALNGLKINVLHPGAEPEFDDANDYSIVLSAEYAGRSILLTGDLAVTGEDFDVPECDVLKVAHHGSAGSSSLQFLAAANPKLALISVAENNMYGLPKGELISRLDYIGARVLKTSDTGMITVHIDPDGDMRANTFIQ